MSDEHRNSRLKEFLLLVRWRIRRLDRAQITRWFYWIVRPASDPYISGDGFRRLADHVYDETWRGMRASRVKHGDVVFISTDRAQGFFERVAPRIEVGYSIITHNSDRPADKALVQRMPANVSLWFAQNNSYSAENVIPLPIGLQNLHHYRAGIPRQFEAMRSRKIGKKNRILVAFDIGTNALERRPAFHSAVQMPSADCLDARLDQDAYTEKLAGYKFVLSPPGNGLDAHRTWEAMYLGVVPIVKESVAMCYFADLGLPLWIVRRWDELRSIDENYLAEKYEQLQEGFRCPALFMAYWRNQIFACARSVAAGNSRTLAPVVERQQYPDPRP